MKTRYSLILFILFLIFHGTVQAQTTTTIQPDAGAGKDALIQMRNSDASVANGNFGDLGSFEAVAWTWGGDPGKIRSLLQFDLSSIPAGAVITDARLSLYNDPTSSECAGQSLSLSGSNAAVLWRATSTWEDSTVTWNNQPGVDTTHQVFLQQSISNYEDYLNIDVKDIVTDMFQNPSTSFGFIIELLNENYYRSMIFASSNNADCSKHPKLEITYQAPAPVYVLTIKPDAAAGKDAMIQMRNSIPALADSNYGYYPDFDAEAWTWSSDPGIVRGLLEFNLTSIPVNAVIASADLSLYNNPTSSETNGEHHPLSGSNASVLRRITSAWNENTVTWNNQPGTTSVDEVTLPQSTSLHEDYLNIDVTALVSYMVANPSSNHGFLIRLVTEQFYRSLIFASSDHADCNRHPKLEVKYSIPTSIPEINDNSQFHIYPNPSSGIFSVEWNQHGTGFTKLKIKNCIGQEILEESISPASGNRLDIDLSSEAKGVYFITLSGKHNHTVKKLVLD